MDSFFLQRRFFPLFVCQFCGAINDNLYKNALVVAIVFHGEAWSAAFGTSSALLTNLANALFILPFFLFSATSGQIADCFDKAYLTRWVKLLEIAIMLLGALGFFYHNLPCLLLGLFLLGGHSTLFGPIKYAVLPQYLTPPELLSGNAAIESGTFIAILLGTFAGGYLIGVHPLWVGATGLALAIVGFIAGCFMPSAAPSATADKSNKAPRTAIDFHIWRATANIMRMSYQQREAWITIVAISWFWLFGAVMLTQIPAYVQINLLGGEQLVPAILLIFTFGIGFGSWLSARLQPETDHHDNSNVSECATTNKCGQRGGIIVYYAAIIVAVCALLLPWLSPNSAVPTPSPDTTFMAYMRLCAPTLLPVWMVFFVMGTAGGLFTVPLYTRMQMVVENSCRARLIAANNILNALFIVGASLATAALLSCGVDIPQVFALLGCGTVLLLMWMSKADKYYRPR